VYVCPVGNEVHTTTNNFLEYICCVNKGHLYSFDISQKHIEFAKDFCSTYAEHVTFFRGDSVENLKLFEPELPISLLMLDSKEFDPDHALNEFLAVKDKLDTNGHYVMVDDIHNPSSVKHKKIVPYLKKIGYNFVEIPTPTGLFCGSERLLLPE
jgi:hypothetical protein